MPRSDSPSEPVRSVCPNGRYAYLEWIITTTILVVALDERRLHSIRCIPNITPQQMYQIESSLRLSCFEMSNKFESRNERRNHAG
jgi:hypothetical protein